MRRIHKLLLLAGVMLPSILPASCSRELLNGLTPYVIDGSSGFMTDLIFFAAPLVVP